MRLQQLALRVHGDGVRLHFHGRLTVIAGLDRPDREGLVEVLLGTLAGEPTVSSELAYVDRTGRRVVVDQTAEGTFHVTYDDGSLALAPSAVFGLDVHQLFAAMYVDAERVGLGQRGRGEPRALTEARAALAGLTDQLEAAKVARDAAEALRLELAAIDREIRQIDTGRPRREYARMMVTLDGLRAEKEALAAGPEQQAMDRAVAERAAHVRPVVAAWRERSAAVDEARRQFGNRERLDEHSLAGALTVPDRVPAGLDALVDRLADAEARRAALSARLAAAMVEHVAPPSHPDVARLARHDQALVWDAAARAVKATLALEQESLMAGGLVAGVEAPAIVQELESAHRAVEAAQELLEKRRLGAVAAGGAAALGAVALPLAPVVAPLALAGAVTAAWWSVIGPRQQLADAQGWEDDALVRAGVPSYLAFHLRRLEAMHDPAVRERLAATADEQRLAMADWRRLGGELSPLEALELEPEVRAYAAAVAAVDGLGDEVDRMRRQLLEEVEPAVERAREALLDVCRPFGIEAPTLAADLVRELAEVAERARRQRDLEEAEAAERAARAALDAALDELRAPGGSTAERLEAFEAWAGAAEARVRARARGRRPEEIDAEIARLENSARRAYRPEFGTTFTAADAAEPDPEALERRRRATFTAYATARRLVPDVERVADRRAAVLRRIAVLEEELGDEVTGELSATRMAELERELQERLAGLRRVGPGAEPLPLLLDDALQHLRPDVKWRMLDLVDRLAGSAQIVYLSGDPDVATWARRRASAGTVTFLDPLGVASPVLERL